MKTTKDGGKRYEVLIIGIGGQKWRQGTIQMTEQDAVRAVAKSLGFRSTFQFDEAYATEID